MGEMADYYLDQGIDEWMDDYSGNEGFSIGFGPLPKNCSRCQVSGLWWSLKDGHYQLIDSAGNKHVCAAASLNAAARKVFK